MQVTPLIIRLKKYATFVKFRHFGISWQWAVAALKSPMWIRGRRGYLSNLNLFNVNFIDWGLSNIKHLPFEYNFLNLKNSDTMIYRRSGCNQVCQNSTKACHSAIWRKSRFTKQFPIFPKFLLIDKIIPTQPSVYSTHSSGLWCHSYTGAKHWCEAVQNADLPQ